MTALNAAWMKIGLAQRDVPAHVINEYCRNDRAFYPCPDFIEDKLPRESAFYNYISDKDETLFSLGVSASSGLGFNFSLVRGGFTEALAPASGRYERAGNWPAFAVHDLAAVSRLDEVRTADLTRSREILGLIEQEQEHAHGSRPL